MPQPFHEQGTRLVSSTPFAAAAAHFLIDRQAANVSPGTLAYYRKKLLTWANVLADLGVTDPLQLTAAHIRLAAVRLAETHSPGGQHALYRALRAFLRWWERETEPSGWHNPIDRIKPPKLADNPLPPLPLDDFKAMLATCEKTLAGQRDRALLLCLLDTGCRASEFLALDIPDVDLASGAVTVRHGKGGKWRVVFLGAKSRRELTRYLRRRGNPTDGALWCTLAGQRLTYGGLRQIVRRRAEAAGVAVPALHSFRRANALFTLRGGADLLSVSKLLGHSDVNVTRRYLKLEHADLAETHRKAGPVDHWVR